MTFNAYINLTSLIMMGTDGECLIEKGVERGRLRIRNVAPKEIQEMTVDKPPIFCQLDAQRHLGQKKLIALAKPTKTIERVDSFANTTFESVRTMNGSETGSMVFPRFRASRVEGVDKGLGQVADDVYAALISDRKMRFVGCLHYPEFNKDQMNIILNRINETGELKEKTGVDKAPGFKIDKEMPFWAKKVSPPWPPEDPTKPHEPKERAEVYLEGKFEEVEEYSAVVEKVKKEEEEHQKALEELASATPDKKKESLEKVKVAEGKLKKENMLASLWPFRKVYCDLLK